MEASDAPVAAVDGVMTAGVGGDGGDGSGSAGRAVDMMYEYAVNMVCPKCSEAVHAALDGMVNVTSVTTNVQAQLVVVEGSVAPAVIVEKLEKIGRKVKLIGSGCATAVEKGVFVVPAAVGPSGENSAAVAEFKGSAARHGTAVGTVRFVGLAAGPPDSGEDGPWVHADVTIDGLAADVDYCTEVHEFGNLSNGAKSTGKLWGPGLVGGVPRRSSPEGRLAFMHVLSGVHVWELIGRAIVIRCNLPAGASSDDSVASVIARSAGVGANHKMLCACDGTVIWDAEALLPGGSGRARTQPPEPEVCMPVGAPLQWVHGTKEKFVAGSAQFI